MRKVVKGERKKKREKIMTLIVATNFFAGRPPKRRATGMPTARANNKHTYNQPSSN